MQRLLAFLSVLITVSAFSQSPQGGDFEIIESVPIETNLDNPDIRNAHDVWLEMIDAAKTRLDIEEFYISNQKGEPLEDIIDAIVKAGKRGVHVRLIADSRMYKTYPETIDSLSRQKNISVRIINFGKLAGGVQHAKYFIVDGETIFLGSQNFDWRALEHIHEIGVRIKHPEAAKVYQDVFNIDWQLAEKNDPSTIATIVSQHQRHWRDLSFHISQETNDTIHFFPTMSPKGLIPDSTLWDEKWIVNLIDRARSEVDCQFLTYSPVERSGGRYIVLDDALRRAATRGVKVKMIVSDWSIGDPIMEHLKSLTRVPNVEVKYSAIPEWSGGYIPFARVEHCKYLVIDSSRCWIGTSNWEKSYFYSTRNVGVVVESPSVTKRMRGIFLKSWDGSYTKSIKPDGEYQARQHREVSK